MMRPGGGRVVPIHIRGSPNPPAHRPVRPTERGNVMTEHAGNSEIGDITVDEVIARASEALGFDEGALGPAGPRSNELARAAVAYLSHRVILVQRMKRADPPGNAGWVAMNHFNNEIRREVADALGIGGTLDGRTAEVRRLSQAARKAMDADGEYREKVEAVVQGFEEEHGLDAESLGIVFV